MLYDNLKRGDIIRITFGSRASQLAVVHDRTRAGNVRVWKYNARRRAWKGPLRLRPEQVMNRARRTEYASLPVLPAAYFKA